MSTADARRAYEKHEVRVVFGDGTRWFWSEVFENNPKIAKKTELKQGEAFAWMNNYPQERPYIQAITDRFIYRPEYKAEPGELFLTPEEEKPKGDFILIEPNTKTDLTGPNKRWEWDRWVKLVRQLRAMGLEVCQVGPKGETRGQIYYPGARILKDCKHIHTPRFRDALGWVKAARLLVSTDGALHHAAAALGTPAVVLWGGVASPKNLGYDVHTNIWHGAEPCGTINKKCPHCKAAMDAISVEEVLKAINGALAKTRH